MSTAVQSPDKARSISGDEALRISHEDATRVYRGELRTRFKITICFEQDGWHIDYDPKDPNANGGGPHYIVDASTGQIVFKRYDQ
jgi:hypothetical protein